MNANKMPAPSPEEKRKINFWDAETIALPVTPPGGLPGADIHANITPIPSPEEKRKTNPWDVETTDLPTIPPARRQGANSSQRVIAPATPLPSTVHFGERQRASLLRQTVQPTRAGSTNQPVSPELARLIEHREQLATQATRQLQT